MNTLEKIRILGDTINEGEKDDAVKLLIDWSAQSGFKEIIFNVLEPLLIEWGKLWMQGKLSLAHGYLSGKVAEEFYMIASQSEEFMIADNESKGTIVLGNIEDDFHPLGRRLVNIFSTAAGWNIIDLGNDVPAEIFIENAIKNQAGIIAVSAMMFTTAKNILKIRKELDRQSLSGKIKLAVGGAVFKLRPELVADIGGDGTADNAIDAPALFDSLIKKVK
jgi:methanogenic corrinoid protein MtbC1